MNLRSYTKLAAIALATASLSACHIHLDLEDGDGDWSYSSGRIKGSGVKSTQSIDIGSFENLRLNSSADVQISLGKSQQITLTTDDNLLSNVSFTIKGDTLVISNDKSYRTKLGTKIDIEVPELDAVKVYGSGDIDLEGAEHMRDFAARVYGSGDISLDDIEVSNLELEVNGSGDIVVDGRTKDLRIKVNGSGDIDARSLEARNAQARVNGSGDIVLHATEELSAAVSGSGDIRYKGSPKVSVKDNGSGDVRSL